MSAPHEINLHAESGSLQFDPTAPDAVHAALVMTHAINELPKHGEISQDAVDQTLPLVDQAREAAMTVLKDMPLPNGKRVHRLSVAELQDPESTGFASISSERDTPWIPATTDEIADARNEITFGVTAATVAKTALEHRATKKPLSFDPEIRAERKEARAVLRNYFGERHFVREAASRFVDAAIGVGVVAAAPLILLAKIDRRS